MKNVLGPRNPWISVTFGDVSIRVSTAEAELGNRCNGHYCTQCGGRIPEDEVVGPINVVIRDPELIGPEGIEREFCTWDCFADWAAVRAGRRAWS